MKKLGLIFITLLLTFSMCLLIGCGGKKPKTYTVTFVEDGQQNIVYTINKGETLDNVPNPIGKTGYDAAWEITDFSSITKDTVINAVYTPINYQIRYELYGGTNSEENPSTYTIESEINLEPAEKHGYEFKGWYTEQFLDNKVTKIEKGCTNTITLYASYQAEVYDITYVIEYNGEKIGQTDNETTYSLEKVVTFKDVELSNKTLSFDGWFLEPNTSTFKTKVESTEDMTGDVILYAGISKDAKGLIKEKFASVPSDAIYTHNNATYLNSTIYVDDTDVYYRLKTTKPTGLVHLDMLNKNVLDTGYINAWANATDATLNVCDASGLIDASAIEDKDVSIFIDNSEDGKFYLYVKVPLRLADITKASDEIGMFNVGVTNWDVEKNPKYYTKFVLGDDGFYRLKSYNNLPTETEMQSILSNANWINYTANTSYKKYAVTLTEDTLCVMLQRTSATGSMFFQVGELYLYAEIKNSTLEVQSQRLDGKSGNKKLTIGLNATTKYISTSTNANGNYELCIAISVEYLEELLGSSIEEASVSMYDVTSAWDGAVYNTLTLATDGRYVK